MAALCIFACAEPHSTADLAKPPSPYADDPEGGPLQEVDATEIGRLLRKQTSQVVLVNMWATWCKPCVEEFPELIAIGRRYEAHELAVVFISADPEANREEAISFLSRQRAPMPSYIKAGRDEPFITALHPDWSGTLPATILFDSRRHPQYLWEEPIDQDTPIGPIDQMLRTQGARHEANPD